MERKGFGFMKLKTRFIVAFFTIILVPIILVVVAVWGWGQYQLKSLESSYGIKDTSYGCLSNSVQVLSKLTQNLYEEVETVAEDEPDRLLDKSYLKELNEKLSKQYSYLIVLKEDQVVYEGNSEHVDAIVNQILKSSNLSGGNDSGIYLGESVESFVKTIHFKTDDNADGTVLMVTPAEEVIPQMRLFIWELVISLVVILVLTSSILMSWIYKSIVGPINGLKVAMNKIKDGNLDFSIEVDTDDELGELCNDFEEMRERLKLSAEEKIEYDRESKELISNISHDLKTPITAIKGYVEGIMDGVADTPDRMDRYIRTIYNKANEMNLLINELTFYSKIDTNKIPYTFSKINVFEYFADCVEEVELELEAQNIDLAYFNYVEEDVRIIADAEQLRRVINNIISNSVKYMDKPKGYINIRVKDVGDFIQVEIEDNGKGISHKDLPFIFDRFYRTDASRNSSKGGSGIGLSIVKKILEDHGGKIWATSKESTGTVMHFVIRKYQEVPIHE